MISNSTCAPIINFHLAQNAQSYAPSIHMRKEIAQTVRDIYQALDQPEAEKWIREAVEKYEETAPKFCKWLEANATEAMTFYKRPREYWKKVRTVNIVERLYQKSSKIGIIRSNNLNNGFIS